mmetsp:Transcript_44564/g.104700  ORF Transcript_44564/g.104700 Transcript_44564/m.104700 type:complete len:239 (+) Transcript_44564:300-1016(+)
MIAPCEKPISVVEPGSITVSRCQVRTASTKRGMAAATRAGRSASVTPRTENHCQPCPRSDGSVERTLTTQACGRCAASASPSGRRSSALEPTPWNRSSSCRIAAASGRSMRRSLRMPMVISRRRSTEDEGIHRQHAVDDAAVEHLPLVLLGRRPCGHQQRPEVFGGRVGACGMRRLGQRTAQACAVAGDDGLAHPGSEFGGVRLVSSVVAAEFGQVVRQAARADDQHAVFGQRSERLA